MTTFSTIPIVKLAITDALTAAFGADARVSYGHPGKAPGIRQAAYVEGTAAWDKDWADLGAQNTDEQYTLAFKLVASPPKASTFQTTTEAVFALADPPTTTVQAIRTIAGVTLILPLLVVPGPDPFTEFFTDDEGAGRASLLDLGIRVRTRLAA